ncbi:coiled-coil domain-containing protein 42 homolog [Pollicipes pollicipes]|uniref:coiled-coil domain-containing protein 42 homolog n=1 Tax=Pollicipes pollicipes TaxID=41117 RepID=UPI0018857929|nr:coiled-coil domain-containing protein 42 homolog [Pollicipes pollicipes]
MKRTDTLNNDLEDYFRIHFENKIAIRPRREDCVLAASTRLLAKKHELEQINDILSRCELLWATKQYLDKRGQKDTNAVKDQLSNMIQYTENRNTETLRLNNLMSELQTHYDQAQRDVINSESNWTRIKNTAAKKTLLLGQIKMAIHNLYQLCNRYHQARVLDQEEIVIYKESSDQLRMIREIMQDIVAVYRECMHGTKHAPVY